MNTHHHQNSLAYKRTKQRLAEKIQANRLNEDHNPHYHKGLVDAFHLLCRSKYE